MSDGVFSDEQEFLTQQPTTTMIPLTFAQPQAPIMGVCCITGRACTGDDAVGGGRQNAEAELRASK
jgi:hypothetical protein